MAGVIAAEIADQKVDRTGLHVPQGLGLNRQCAAVSTVRGPMRAPVQCEPSSVCNTPIPRQGDVFTSTGMRLASGPTPGRTERGILLGQNARKLPTA